MREETRDLTIGEALDLGCQMAMAGRNQDAIGLFMGVLAHEPNNFEAIERLGTSLFELKRYTDALYWFWRGRKINRKHPLALSNYGMAVSQLGHLDEGLVEMQKAVYQIESGKHPSGSASKAVVYNNIGNTLEKLKRHAEALIYLDKGIAQNPKDAFPHYNRGIVLLRLNRQIEAIAALNRAIELNPNDPDALYNRGMGRLLTGDLAGGFEDYEARLLTSENKVINLGLPAAKKWDGSDLTGKRLLVHCEQGLGDDIQFLRFLPGIFRKNPEKVLLIPHSAVVPILALPPAIELRKSGEPIDEADYDCWVALMSLPHYLGLKTEADIPHPTFLALDPLSVERWDRLVREPDRLNVGVCWAGNFLHKNDAHRSIPLATFAELFDVPGVNFVSLQQLRPGEADLFAKLQTKHQNLQSFVFENFRDTAAAAINLDMVISVDSAIAHLSATLAVPTTILVPAFGTDWRWMLEREDSPWYSAAKLHRQPKVGDWVTVIRALRNELAAMVSQSRAA